MDGFLGRCTFEEVSADDLLDAARSMRGLTGTGNVVRPPGYGVDEPINAAVLEVAMASRSQNQSDRIRSCIAAVASAKRAVSCLVDWYLTGHCFAFCKDAPRTSQEKSALLLRRQVVDELTSHVLERAVNLRNRIEHEYESPSLDDSENVVELIRRTIQHIKKETNPELAPCLFGLLSGYAAGSGMLKWYGWFDNDPVFLIAGFANPPWLGVIEPSGKDVAHVRRAHFAEAKLQVYEEILSTLEMRFPRISSYTNCWPELAKLMGLV
jgi:uncharacterized protein YutE (UPF0331/DUF86 family)